MPRNGSGVYSLPNPPFVTGTVISSVAMNGDLSDIASALTGSLPVNGTAPMTGQLRNVDGSTINPSIAFTNETNTGFIRAGTGQIGIVIQGTQVAYIDSNGFEGPTPLVIPVGTVSDFAGSTAPSKWYLCYGQAVSRTTYSALFAVIGTTYGSGDGVTTFNLPDLRGLVVGGQDNMGGTIKGTLTSIYFGTNPDVLGAQGGGQSETLSLSQIPTGITAANTAAITVNVTGNQSAPNASRSATAGGSQVSGTGAITPTATGTIAIGSVNVTSNNTGGNPHGNVQPTILMSKIIYAGI